MFITSKLNISCIIFDIEFKLKKERNTLNLTKLPGNYTIVISKTVLEFMI